MKPYMTIEEIISVPSLSQPAISEDGTKLAWVKTTANWDKNEYRKHVQICQAHSKGWWPLSFGQHQSHSPCWSFDGKLAFLSPVGEGGDKADQVFVISDGASYQATQAVGGVSFFRWAPDGNGIYYVAPHEKKRGELKERKERYGDFVYSGKDEVPNCIYYAALDQDRGPGDLRGEKGSPEPLVGGEGLHVLTFDVAPDGAALVMLCAPTPDGEGTEKPALYTYHLKIKRFLPVPVSAALDGYGKVLFSPDGGRVCYSVLLDEGKWYNISTLEVSDLQGNVSRPLAHLDECPRPVRWTQKGLVFTLQQKTEWYVYMLDDEGSVSPLSEEQGGVTMSVAVSHDGEHMIALTATRENPQEIYLDGERVTDQRAFYRGKTLSRKEVVGWVSHDGTAVEGILIKPADVQEGRLYPLLVLVHGGPTWAAFPTITDDRYYPIESFVERGFIVLDVNYRGSSGYGAKFRKLNYRNLGLGDYEDVISGVDTLVQKGLVDRDRVGIMGWSQGGYISAMCTAYSDRFKAVSVGAGISSWYTYYTNTDIPPFTRHYLGHPPWDDEEIYARTSPMTYVKGACTPTLIQHGDADDRVPYANAKELHRALKDMGVPVTLVTFKGMGHGSNKPGLHRAIMKQNYAWFCHHLLGDDLDDLYLS